MKMNDHKKNFLRIFDKISCRHNRWDVFSDFVDASAAAIHNRICFDEQLEQGYLKIAERYSREDMDRLCALFAEMAMALDGVYDDFLGSIFHELELHNRYRGQFFTPFHIAQLCAALTEHDFSALLDGDKPFMTCHEPAVGSGVMVIALAEQMAIKGLDPSKHLWVSAWDIDARAARMAYLQFSLLGIPAEVVIGNTITLEARGVLRTPMHYIRCWDEKLSLGDEEVDRNWIAPVKVSDSSDQLALL